MFQQIILLSLLFNYAYFKCAFKVDGEEKPEPAPEPREPFPSSPNTVCPFMPDDQQYCCSKAQINTLAKNFQAIDATFGSPGAGCDLCAANLKRFWCIYTCSPEQASFVSVFGDGLVPDPKDASHTQKVLVQLVNLTVNSQAACDVFGSCKRTQFASLVSAMQSPGGFFNFQGQNAISQAQQFITVDFIGDADTSLSLPDASVCNQQITKINDKGVYVDEYGFTILQNCTCNNCDAACSKDPDATLYKPTGVWEGFDTWLVVGVWIGVILAVVAISGVRFYMGKKRAEQYSRVENEYSPFAGNA